MKWVETVENYKIAYVYDDVIFLIMLDGDLCAYQKNKNKKKEQILDEFIKNEVNRPRRIL